MQAVCRRLSPRWFNLFRFAVVFATSWFNLRSLLLLYRSMI
jgi:hypothetical protein